MWNRAIHQLGASRTMMSLDAYPGRTANRTWAGSNLVLRSSIKNRLAVVRNCATFLTALREYTMSTTAAKIVQYAQQQPEGAVFGANELVACGERAAIDQALVRLTATGELTRVVRGVYALTVPTRFGRRAPELERLVLGYARREALVIARHGGAEANRLGLSTQVPMHAVWLTSGPTTDLQAGALTIELKRAPRWLLVDPEGRAGAALRAVAWLGAEAATEHFARVRDTLTTGERQTILDARGLMPSWMARSASAALAHG